MTGSTISHYRILGPLGTGGMSVVYLAEDLRLGRQVALKFLPPALEHHPAALERLRREARLTSALNHPYICTIHDINEHDGRTFLVMERLEGETLKRLIEREGGLPVERALRLGAQIADALAAAHAHGIVHRDVKPGNVFVTPRDEVKVTDFGLAKQLPLVAGSEDSTVAPGLTDALTLTSPGEAVGTIAYMSPEQARGDVVNARSDLFSLGAVLYEMLTGRRAFPGTAPAVVFDAILNQASLPLDTYVSGLPVELSDVVGRLLAKQPADRYQNGADLRDDLLAIRERAVSGSSGDVQRRLHASGSGTRLATPASGWPGLARLTGRPDTAAASRGRAGWWRRPRIRGAVAGGAAVVMLAVVVTMVLRRSERAVPLTERDSIMLGAFQNTTGDPVFDGTLREALAVQLDQSPFLQIVPSERVNEALRLMSREPDAGLPHDVAREACVRLNAKALIDGAIRSLGQHFVLALTATNCPTGDTIAIEQAEVERKEDVLKGIGRSATALRARLGESLSTIESFGVPIEQATTPSLEALKAYTLGQAARAQGAEIESVPFFQRAVELDPAFASAWYALSLVYGNLGESARGAEYGARAYAEREGVSERERLAITYQYHDRVTGELAEAIAALELWKRLYPRDYRPASSLAVAFNRTGQFERAASEAREALRRGDDRGLAHSNLAYALRGLNRFDDARQVATEAMSLGIETLPTRRLLFQLALMRQDQAEAGQHRGWAEGRPQQFDFVGAEAQVAAYQGRWAAAQRLFRETVDMAVAAGLEEVAGAYGAQAAWSAAALGYPEVARAEARALLDAPPQVALLAAAALAQGGDVTGLARAIEGALAQAPRDTLLHAVGGSAARAALLLAQRRPREAIEILRPALPFDAGRAAALTTLHLRAEALSQTGDHAAAAGEFQRLLDHRGTEPFSILHAVAPLGLARALRAAGNPAAAANAYHALLDGFRDADPDLPIVRQARQELQGLEPAGSGSLLR